MSKNYDYRSGSHRKNEILRMKWLGYSFEDVWIRWKKYTKYLKNPITRDELKEYWKEDLIINGRRNINERRK